MKNAKRNVIVSSFMAIALCMSIVAGATFALFTSNSSVNIAITSGNVEVVATASDLVVYSPTSVNGTEIVDRENAAKGLTFANGGTATLTGNELKLDNMTPGDKASFTITVENKSTVAVKYRTKLVCSENDGLYSGLVYEIGGYKNTAVTDWQTLGDKGEIAKFDCFVELPVKAGSEYNNKKCTLEFVVEAVQGNAEISYTDVAVTPETIANVDFTQSDAVYRFGAGSYVGTTLTVKNNSNTVFEADAAATFDNITIKYAANRYGETDKSKSSMTVRGFNVTGVLDINCADGKLIVENNSAKQINITMNRQDGKNNADIQIKNNKIDGGKYGVQLVPNHSDYTLTISGNEFANLTSHAISVMGYQSDLQATDETRTTAASITVSGNVFNSYGKGKAAFKIWGDIELAPASSTPLNEKAKALAKSIKANNTFGELADGCVVADFYGATYAFD